MHMHWLVLMLGIGGLAMCFGRCRRNGTPHTALTLIAVASIIGGFMMFAHKSDDRQHVTVARRDHAVAISDRIREQVTREVHEGLRDLDQLHDVDVRFEHEFPFAAGELQFDRKPGKKRIGAIALGAVLVICGWLLFNRNRSRPVGMKAVTVLGLVATGAILFSFVRTDSAPRRIVGRDTVVRNSDHRTIEAPRSDHLVAEPAPPREIRRARQPIERAKRPVPREPDALPPRAGEIPVAAELAQTSAGVGAEDSKPLDKKPAGEGDDSNAGAAPEGQPGEGGKVPDAVTRPAEPAQAPADEAKPAEPQVAEETIAEPTTAGVKDAEPKIEVHVASPAPQVPPVGATEHTVASESDDALPDWANTPGKLIDTVYRVSIQSGLYADVPECQAALDDQIKAHVEEYIDRWMGEGTAALVAIDREYLNKHIKKAEYSEVVNTASVGPMHQIHALLEFDDEARSVFHERWRRAIVTERVWIVGFGAAVVLALLSMMFGYLKLDLQTGGTHSGRLQLAATLVALMVAAGALLARSAVPF